ncbi:LEM domain-containing protein 2-like [Huso huso]|uniref:LEM domain-containing protein 2-like n=1 Tax=Huso huso TaxID=61971 RepID=A0ABR0YDJ4_HUSHU
MASTLDDDELRRELKSFGFCPGPISDSTRKLYLNKLKKLGSENCSKSRFARTQRSHKHGLSSSSSNIASSPQHQTQHSHRHDSLRLRENSASPSHRYRTPSFNQQDSDESDDYEAYSHYGPPAAHANQFTSYTKEDLQKRCDSTVKQNVFLDRQLSRALFTCTLVLSAMLIWLVYVKTVGLGQNEDVKNNLKMLPVDCKGKTDTYCRAEEHKVHMQLLSELYSFLAKVAGDFECGNPSELKSKCVSVDDAKSYLAILNRGYTDRFEAALQMIIQSRRDLGIRVVEPGHAPGAVRCLESSQPQMGLVCRFSRAVFTVMSRMFIFVLALGVLWGVLILLRYRWRRLQEEEQAMYELVKRIIGEVRDHYKDWDQGLEPIPYVPIPHVRDSLIPPQNRRRMRRIWDRAVEFLSSNESRIRTETHRIAGEDFLVWRWTQPVELSDSS